jgi:hypothetical protein
VDDWKGELQPWSEAAMQLRKARRPDGWRTTPAQLRDRARATDPVAISLLCRVYQQLVNNHLRRRSGVSPEAADEATQEVFTALLTRNWLSKLVLNPEDSFGSWLISRAFYSLKKHWAREKKLQRLLRAPEANAREEDPTASSQSFEEQKAKFHFELRASQEDRQDLKTPEDIVAGSHDAKLLERLFARIEPKYTRRRQGLFARLKATLLERTSEPDAELDKRASDRWLIRKELGRAAHYLENETRARNPNYWREGGGRTGRLALK